MGVHLVSVAAVTKYHTKPHKFIISQFYRLESLYGSFWAKTKVLAGLLLPGGSSGEFISLPFLIPRGYLHPWLMVPSSTFRACNRVQPRGGVQIGICNGVRKSLEMIGSMPCSHACPELLWQPSKAGQIREHWQV